MNSRRQGSIIGAIFWMFLLSLLLFWAPLLGPIIAGYVGGKKAGGFFAALLAVFLPGIVFGILLYVIASSMSGIPLLGAIAGAGGFILSLAHIGPLLLGAMIGGLLAPKRAIATPEPSSATPIATPAPAPSTVSVKPVSPQAKRDWRHCLEASGLGQYIELFEENDIDEEIFCKLTEDDLKDLGISSIGSRKRILRAISGYRTQPDTYADEAAEEDSVKVIREIEKSSTAEDDADEDEAAEEDSVEVIREIEKGSAAEDDAKELIEQKGIDKATIQRKITAIQRQWIGRLTNRKCALPLIALGFLVVAYIIWGKLQNPNYVSPQVVPSSKKHLSSSHQERIVFHKHDGTEYQIYSMNPDGSDVVKITDSPERKVAPRISPDGTMIAYLSWKGSGDYVLLKVVDADGSNPRTVVDITKLGMRGLTQCEWTPDSKRLIYSGNVVPSEDRIYIINIDGSGNQLAPMEHRDDKDHSPDMSDDGKLIAYIYDSGNWHFSNTVRLYNYATKADVQLIGGNGQSNTEPRISPSNRYVIWRQDNGRGSSGTNIYRMNIDGSGVVNLTNTPKGVNNGNGDWSPDGSKIVFVRNGGRYTPGVWVMNADGSGQRQILEGKGVGGFGWGYISTDGGKATSSSQMESASSSIEPLNSRPGWRFGPDQAGVNYYRYGSTLSAPGPFALLWSRKNVGKLLTGDIDGDGVLDIVTQKDGNVVILNGQGREINTFTLTRSTQIGLHLLEDFTDDGILDLVFGASSGASRSKTLYLYLYDHSGKLLQTFTKQGTDSSIGAIARSSDGDLIASLWSGFGRDPRGWSGFDVRTGKEKWYYDVGPMHESTSIADFDHDGFLEFTNLAASVHNGAKGTGKNGRGTRTTDGDFSTIVIDENGNEEWTVGYTSDGESDGRLVNKFADLDRDGKYEVIAFEEHDRIYGGTSQIHILDASSGRIFRTFDVGRNVNWDFRHLIIADLNGDGKDEILLREDSGTYHLLDHNLRELKKGRTSMRFIVANDLDGDKAIEIIAIDGGTLRVLNGNLEEEWTYKAPAKVQNVIVSDVNGNGANELLVVAENTLYVLGDILRTPLRSERAALREPSKSRTESVAESIYEVFNTARDSPDDPFLNLRSGPGPSNALVAKMPDGSQVRVLEKGLGKSKRWWKLYYVSEGKTGYAHSKWIRLRDR